jgi:uncharacterized membrane protein
VTADRERSNAKEVLGGAMEELIKQVAGHVALAIEMIAILIVTVGALEAAGTAVRMLFITASDTARRNAMLKFEHWLAVGLTFQLAGDIVHTAVTPTWDDIGRLAAIAVIRTFLTYFLERDIKELRELPAKRGAESVVTE